MKNKIHVGLVATLIAAIGAFGFFETLEAAPKESQRLRGLEGRAFLVEAFLDADFTIPNPPGGSYCYIFNSSGEWIDERFAFGGPPVPGAWGQDSVGAATGYTAMASAFEGFIEIYQEGHVTPASGRGVLQLEAVTDVLVGGELAVVLFARGYEVEANECSLPPPDGD
jgi:hypothetical protein